MGRDDGLIFYAHLPWDPAIAINLIGRLILVGVVECIGYADGFVKLVQSLLKTIVKAVVFSQFIIISWEIVN